LSEKIRLILFPPGIEEYKEDFNRKNAKALSFLLFSGALLSLLFFIGEHIFKVSLSSYLRTSEYLFFFAVSAGMRLSYRREIDSCGTKAMYIWSGILLAYSLALFAGDRQSNSAFIFLLYLLVLTLLIRDAWGHVLILLVVGALSFIVVDLIVHEGECFRLAVVTVLAGGFLSARTDHERITIMTSSSQAETRAEHDGLTEIYNRRGGEALISSYVENETAGAFIIIDVDNFKHVNDTYGHAKGDLVLKQVADVLKKTFRETDVVMRMGGDEFIVYALGMADIHNVEYRLDMLVSAIHDIILNDETGEYLTASIGCIINLGSYPSYESLSVAADKLLYYVKNSGKDRYICSDKDYVSPASSQVRQ
jgi:diguanylate cyclase (GGDEF)-like protein